MVSDSVDPDGIVIKFCPKRKHNENAERGSMFRGISKNGSNW
jgi:hypothetical protein